MIPDGWIATTLGEISNVRRGASPRPIQDPKWFSEDGPGWIRIVDVTKSDRFLRTTEQKLSPLGVEKSVSVHPGDLIMSICATIGRPVIVDMEACIHDGFVLFEDISPKIDSLYLLYFLTKESQKFDSQGQPGTQKNINTSIVKSTSILLPPLSEQKKIAEILSSVDEAIASTQAVIDQTRKVKQGLLQQLLTHGIGHTKFKESAIGKIPESWNLVTIKDLVLDEPNSLTAGPFGTIFKAKDFRDSGVPIVQIRHVTEDGFSWGNKVTYMDKYVYEQLHKPYTIKSGDLLITKMGEPPGIACIYPDGETFGMVTPDVIKASLNPKKVDTYFLMSLYNSPQLKKRILDLTKGGTRSRVTLDEFYKLLLPCPPLDEQMKISNILFALDEFINREKNKLENSEQMKRGLMQDLLTGRVRVKALANE